MEQYQVDPYSLVPLVHQIARLVRKRIARGELVQGNYLPSVRELGQELNVNFNTVAKAYRILGREGLVEIRHGLGARVKSQVVENPGKNKRNTLLDELNDVICQMTLSGSDQDEVVDLFAEAIGAHYESKV